MWEKAGCVLRRRIARRFPAKSFRSCMPKPIIATKAPASSGLMNLLKNSWIIFCSMGTRVEPPRKTTSHFSAGPMENSAIVHLQLIKLCSSPRKRRSRSPAWKKTRLRVLRGRRARRFPARSFRSCLHKSKILAKSSAAAFSTAQETGAGQCVLVCGLPASSLLPSTVILVGGLGFAVGNRVTSSAELPLARSGSSAHLQHFATLRDREKIPNHPCVLPRTCDRGQSVTKNSLFD